VFHYIAVTDIPLLGNGSARTAESRNSNEQKLESIDRQWCGKHFFRDNSRAKDISMDTR
jgi:hypothetical protein